MTLTVTNAGQLVKSKVAEYPASMVSGIPVGSITTKPVTPAGGFHGTSQATTTEESAGGLPAVQVPQDEWRQKGALVVDSQRSSGSC
jgi:hypothetical protein